MMTEEQAAIATPATRKAWAKEFQENPFWRKLMKPHLELRQKQMAAELVTCELSDVKKIRGMIVAIEDAVRFPEDLIASIDAEIAMEKAQLAEIEKMHQAAQRHARSR